MCAGDLSGEAIRARELGALEEAMEALSLRRGTLVTFDREERVRTKRGIVRCVPADEWLTELEDTRGSARPRA